VVLGAGAADLSWRAGLDRGWFAGEWLAGQTGQPVERVLQDAWHRVIVFGCYDDDAVGFCDRLTHREDRGGEACRLDVGVVERDVAGGT
jgi:hypothetical protein